MSWAAVIAGGAALVGGVVSSQGAKSAAGKSASGSAAALAEQARQYDTTRADTAPYRAIGTQAINALGSIYGYKPAATPQTFEQWSAANPAAAAPPAKKHHSGGIGGFLNKALNPIYHYEDIANKTKQVAHGDIAGALTTGGIFAGNALSKMAGGAAGGGAGDPRQVAYQAYLSGFDSSPKSNPANNGGYAPTPGGGIEGRVTVGGDGAAAGPDYSSFFASPDYQFRRGEGTRGIERSAAAGGLIGSGNAIAALDEYNSNLAAGEFGNFFNRQAALAGIGQTATNTATQAGMNAANNSSALLQNSADARASGIADSANAWGNALGTIGGIVYDRWGRPKKGN